MRPADTLLKKMRRLWILEHSARRLLLTLGWAVDAWLLFLVLHRAAGLGRVSVLAVTVLATAVLAAIVVLARARVPSASRLAQMVDERAGSSDLFASALEFHGEPERFGWLGELTCAKARAEAGRVVLRPRWSFGPVRHWAAVGAGTLLLCAAYAGTIVLESLKRDPTGSRPVTAQRPERSAARGKPAGDVDERGDEGSRDGTSPAGQDELEAATPKEPEDKTVKITNEMIDKYLRQVAEQQDIDLEGVTPIRWDDDEASGKSNPQNRSRGGEKIDPVKLDAALLKDLQAAKKTKTTDADKEKGGVDVAVIGKPTQAARAKGKKGGKDDKGSLAGAVSKDPRGEPTRLAVKPLRKGLQIRSAARSPANQPGQERPMGLLDFLAAMRRAQAKPVEPHGQGAPQAADRSADRVVRQESVPDAAAEVVESYFGRLREADR